MSRYSTPCTLALIFALAGFNGFAACNSDGGGSPDCQPGTEFCECLGGTTCSGGLTCTNGFCVVPGSGSATGSEDATNTDGGMSTGDGDATASADDASGGMEEGGPSIVDFGTNVASITEGETVIFTATVIDPDGPADIQGGSLKSADGAINYGAFDDQGDGTYSFPLSWAAAHQALPLEFVGMETRTFRVEFFDNTGKLAWQTTDIGFTCAGGCAWDGTCPDTQTDDEHCGTCGNACEIDEYDFGHCEAGACTPRMSQCVMGAADPASCDEVCNAQGETCSPVGCGDDNLTLIEYFDSDCNDSEYIYFFDELCTYPNEPLTFGNYRCCCEQ